MRSKKKKLHFAPEVIQIHTQPHTAGVLINDVSVSIDQHTVLQTNKQRVKGFPRFTADFYI